MTKNASEAGCVQAVSQQGSTNPGEARSLGELVETAVPESRVHMHAHTHARTHTASSGAPQVILMSTETAGSCPEVCHQAWCATDVPRVLNSFLGCYCRLCLLCLLFSLHIMHHISLYDSSSSRLQLPLTLPWGASPQGLCRLSYV